jgi:hypothetical protein
VNATIRCTGCRSEFRAEDVEHMDACPRCGTTDVPELVDVVPPTPMYPTDLHVALGLCQLFGHLCEGRLHGDRCHLVGRCQRCGAGMLTDR